MLQCGFFVWCKGDKLNRTNGAGFAVFSQIFPETGRIWFRRARFQTPNSVSFFALTEFRGENSVSSSQPIICVTKRTHRVFLQNSPSLPQNSVRLSTVLFSETLHSKQYSTRFLYSLIFASPGNISILEVQHFEGNRRKPPIFAENQRKPQNSAETRLSPFSFSFLIPP